MKSEYQTEVPSTSMLAPGGVEGQLERYYSCFRGSIVQASRCYFLMGVITCVILLFSLQPDVQGTFGQSFVVHLEDGDLRCLWLV